MCLMSRILSAFRILFVAVVLSVFVTNVFAQGGAGSSVSLEYDSTSPQVIFAAGEISEALERMEYSIREGSADTKIALTTDSRLLQPQHYRIRYEQPDILRVTGGDAAGTMYGGMELAEMLQLGTDLSGFPQREGKPFILRRGLKFNIPFDARVPSYDDTGDAAQQNIAVMWDFDFWREFLDDMARHRYNLLTLWSTHPYPTLVKLENYPDIAYDDVSVLDLPIDGQTHSYWTDTAWSDYDIMDPANLRVVKRITIDEKIVFWQRVMQYAADRNIDIYLFSWNIHMWGARGKYGIDNRQDNPKTVAYLRESVKELLLTYPLIKGIGVTAGENMNRRLTGEYSNENWVWKTYGLGVMDVKAIQPDRDVRFIYRQLDTKLEDVHKAFGGYTGVLETSFKYSRARIYTTTNPQFFDQGYRADVEKYQIKCWMNLRNDDIFVHRWGNPEHVRKFLENMPHDVMAGFYMGSDGYVWGREFISLDPEQPRQLEIRKHWYNFMLWGRLAYDPTLSRDFFESKLTDRFPGVDATLLYDTWKTSSEIIPQLNRFYWFGNDRQWSPEASVDMHTGFHTVNRFIDYRRSDTSTLPNQFGSLTFRQYVESVISGTDIPGVTPLQVALNLDRFSEHALAGVSTLRKNRNNSKELKQTLTDIESMSHLGRYYADKIRGAVELALFRLTNDPTQQRQAVQALEAAVDHWKSYATVATSQYKPQLFATTQELDWWKLLEYVEQDVIIAKENIQLWPGAPLLKSLETEFQPKWEKLKDSLNKNKIEEFAVDIEKLGMEYRYFFLSQWGNKLAAQAVESDSDAISKTLERFPDLIKDLKGTRYDEYVPRYDQE